MLCNPVQGRQFNPPTRGCQRQRLAPAVVHPRGAASFEFSKGSFQWAAYMVRSNARRRHKGRLQIRSHCDSSGSSLLIALPILVYCVQHSIQLIKLRNLLPPVRPINVFRRSRNLALRLSGAPRPLPEPTRNLSGQTISQLAGEHDNLPTMMTFMSDEIGQDMRDVEGKVAPGV